MNREAPVAAGVGRVIMGRARGRAYYYGSGERTRAPVLLASAGWGVDRGGEWVVSKRARSDQYYYYKKPVLREHHY